jgi:hypothetical protein
VEVEGKKCFVLGKMKRRRDSLLVLICLFVTL